MYTDLDILIQASMTLSSIQLYSTGVEPCAINTIFLV